MVGRMSASQLLLIFFATVLTIVFLVFIVIDFGWSPIPKELEASAHVVANIWTLLNLSVIGLSIVLIKWTLPSRLLRMAKNINRNDRLTLDLNLISRPGIVNKMEYIADKTKATERNSYLFWRAYKALQNDNLYFLCERFVDGSINVKPLAECTKQLKEHINNSNFNNLQKLILNKTIKEKPHCVIFDKMITDIVVDREAVVVNNRWVKMFIRNGIIIKKEH